MSLWAVGQKPLIAEGSYRMVSVSQALGIDTRQEATWVALEEAGPTAISPMALWGLVQWLGQLSPAQLNLALGVEPPTHVIEDEKHVKECGQKAYMPIVYAPKEVLIWWVDYIDSVSEDTLRDSLECFKVLSERLAGITGATVDGWESAHKALQDAFPGITLAECHMHALIKMKTITKNERLSHLAENEHAALAAFVDRLRQQYGDDVLQVVLFGSKARGDFDEESDLDVLVVVRIPDEGYWQHWKQIVDLAWEVEFEHGVVMLTIVKTADEYAKMHRDRLLFYRNIEQDGVTLWTRQPDAITCELV